MKFVLMGFATILGLGLGIFVIWTSLQHKSSKYAFGGAIHAFLGNYEKADHRYGKALEFDPGRFDALDFMASRHAAAREFPQAVSCYERCLRQRPGDPNCMFKLGAAFLRYEPCEPDGGSLEGIHRAVRKSAEHRDG